ncbi:uncharacterized protein LOC127809289 [Diospyros lotus]|uniref:uncharacterized protein LOC127809289 n=1 Tax=Diospyros lotus TaxID=55363 RepID=UPI00224CC0BA|nr:uncharacterized protein LOC127809289 [Diospyros lotus]
MAARECGCCARKAGPRWVASKGSGGWQLRGVEEWSAEAPNPRGLGSSTFNPQPGEEQISKNKSLPYCAGLGFNIDQQQICNKYVLESSDTQGNQNLNANIYSQNNSPPRLNVEIHIQTTGNYLWIYPRHILDVQVKISIFSCRHFTISFLVSTSNLLPIYTSFYIIFM